MFRADTAALLRRFAADERGTTLIEYAIIAVCIAVPIIVIVGGIGSTLKANLFEKVATALGTVM